MKIIKLYSLFLQMQENNQPVFFTYDFNCIGYHTVELSCINQKCSYPAFLCSNDLCVCRKDKHDNCEKTPLKILLQEIQNRKINPTQEQQQSLNTLIQYYDKLIQKLSADRQSYFQEIKLIGLDENMKSLVNLLNNAEQDQIRGQLMKNIKTEIDNQNTYRFSIPKLSMNQQNDKLFLPKIENLPQAGNMKEIFQTGISNLLKFQNYFKDFRTKPHIKEGALDGKTFSILNKGTRQVFDANNNGSTYTLDWNGGHYQQYKFIFKNGGYRIKSRATGKCLELNPYWVGNTRTSIQSEEEQIQLWKVINDGYYIKLQNMKTQGFLEAELQKVYHRDSKEIDEQKWELFQIMY